MCKTLSQSLSLTCPLAWLDVLKPHPFLSHSVIAFWLSFCTPGGETYSLCCTQVKTLAKHCLLTLDLKSSCENFKPDRSHILTKATFTLLTDSHPFSTSSFIFHVSQIQRKNNFFSYSISKEFSPFQVLASTSLPSSWLVLQKTSLQKTAYLFLSQSSSAFPLALPSAPITESEVMCQQVSLSCFSFLTAAESDCQTH